MNIISRLLVLLVMLGGLGASARSASGQQAKDQKAKDQRGGDLRTLDGGDGRDLLLRNFRPKSTLKVSATNLTRAKYAAVDVHTHFFFRTRHSDEVLDEFVRVMDRNNVAVCVSLDGRLGKESFVEHRDFLWKKYKQRFVVFAHIDWRGEGDEDKPATWDCQRPDFARRVVRQLEAAKKEGASGLKIFKRLGLGYRNADGSLIAIDDRRWDPIWDACGRLGLPVLIHTADPAAFFDKIDAGNERWEELHRHPEWSFPAAEFPSRKQLLSARNRVIARHSRTVFIGAHVANNPENLAEVAAWLDKYPNLNVELASRIGELGRQPYTARAFFLRYADRILFGTDGPWPETRLRLYWRFLETFDENFPYSEKPFPPQGFWNIYGIKLPDTVLRKIYQQNAARLIPGVAERLPATAAAPR